MKKIYNNRLIFFFGISIVAALFIYCLSISAAYSFKIRTRHKYSYVIKRLTFYKEELASISYKIAHSDSALHELKSKIKKNENKIRKIKKRIKRYRLLIEGLIERIFIIHKEYLLAEIIYFKGDTDAFVLNYQLKILLKNEEARLLKLVKIRNGFLRLRKYLKKEKSSFTSEFKSIKRSKERLKDLITGLNNYIESLKINNGKTYAGYNKSKEKRKDKKNRLLKRKVIKLIKNLQKKSRNGDAEFQIIK